MEKTKRREGTGFNRLEGGKVQRVFGKRYRQCMECLETSSEQKINILSYSFSSEIKEGKS